MDDELRALAKKFTVDYNNHGTSSTMIYNALRRAGIKNLADLKKATVEYLSDLRTVGPKKLDIIIQMRESLLP